MMDFASAFSAGVLQPADLNALQAIFDRVTGQVWFSQTSADRRAFAAYLLQTYRRGMTDPGKLEAFCMAAARARFSSEAGVAVPESGLRGDFLIVEDEPILAREVSRQLILLGAGVVGPVASVAGALALMQARKPDAAILDIALYGETVYPLASLLMAQKIPFAFVSGVDNPEPPMEFRHVPVFSKPADWTKVAAYLSEA